LNTLAVLFVGRPKEDEKSLEIYVEQFTALSPNEQEQVRLEIHAVVGGLARLSMRLNGDS